jgi:chloramphenicol-sensitive protein RarD
MQAGDPGGRRAGITAGIGAYLLWGLFPLYWGFLEPSSPYEVLAARVVFALLSLVLLVAVARQWSEVRAVLSNGRQAVILAMAAVLVSVNWGVFIWAVANDKVVDTSLGYFINPLVSVALGVVVLHERLRRLQWVAVTIAALAVLYATVSLGAPPWIALALAFSFGFYGLATKLSGVDAIPSLFVQTLFLTPFALGYLVWLSRRGELALGHHGLGHTLLVIGAGPVTALPLLLFGYAAHRVPLTLVGLLQYIAPTLQLIIGVWWFGEPMSPQRWAAFVGVWIALVLFSVDAVRHARARSEPALVADL